MPISTVRARQTMWLLPMVLCLLAQAGCATFDQCSVSWLGADSGNHGEVAQLAALWADGVDVRPDPTQGGAPTPGFAGRLYLFGADCKESFVADGTITVQLYDDAQAASKPAVPREVWNITEDCLAKVLTKDALGWGYDLWLPWSNYQKNINKVALVVVYKPKAGKEVWSGNSIIAIRDDGKPWKTKLQSNQTVVKSAR